MLLCGASTRQPDSYSWGNDYFAFIKYVFLSCFLHGSSTWNQCKFSVWAVLCVPNVMVDRGALYSLAASFCFHVPWAGCGQDLTCRTAVRAIKVPAGQGYSLQDLQVGRRADLAWKASAGAAAERKAQSFARAFSGPCQGSRFAENVMDLSLD